MSCPHYQDFTRNCLNEYPTLAKFESFVKCESDDYPQCIFYHILRNDFRCKHLKTCSKKFPEEIPKFIKLISTDKTIYALMEKQVYTYCLSRENHDHCARYKKIEEETQPSSGLIPDGSVINEREPLEKDMIVDKNKP
jgi:hypothetical protein